MIPETQREAYEAIKPSLSDRRQAVYEAIYQSPDGLTLFELAEILHWEINRVSGRVTELADLGRIRDSGQRRVNPHSGKRGIVWSAANFDESGQAHMML